MKEATESRLEAVRHGARSISRAIAREREADALLRHAAHALAQAFDSAVVSLAQWDEGGLRRFAVAGEGQLADSFRATLASGQLPACWQRVRNQPEQQGCWECHDVPECGGLVAPIGSEGRYQGALLLMGGSTGACCREEQELLLEVAEDLGYALHGLEGDQAYRSLFNHSLDGVAHHRMIFDGDEPVDYVFLQVNRAFEELTGLAGVEGRPVSQVIPGLRQADPELFATYARVVRTGQPASFETFVQSMDRWFSVCAYRTHPDHFVAVFENVSERKRAEAALRESEGRFRGIFEQAAVGMAVVESQTGRFLRVNQKLTELVGYTAQELVEMTYRDLTPVEEANQDREHHQRMLADPHWGFSHEKFYRRKDGTLMRARLTTTWLNHDAPGPPSFISVIEDVTDRYRAAQALRESEERWHTAFDLNLAGLHIARLSDHRILDVNPALESLLGWSRPEMIGRTTQELQLYVDPEVRQRVYAELEERGVLPPLECRIRRRSGQEGHFLLAAGRAEIGGQACLLGVWHDITALRESEGQWRSVFEVASVGVAQADPFTRRLLYANQRLSAITGYSVEELLTMTVEQLNHPGDESQDGPLFRRLVAGELSEYRLEKRYLRKDGQAAWVNVNVTVLRDGAGRPLRCLAIVEDIGPRKQAEAALRASQEQYRTLVDNLEDVVFSAGPSGRLSFVNEAIRRLGYLPQDVIGLRVDRLLHPDEKAVLRRLRRGQLEGLARREWRVLDASGKVHLMRALLRLQPDQGGVTGVAVDVTEQRATEEQLRAAQKMEAVGRLAGGVAHDFNNLLSVILSYTELGVAELPEGDPLRADLQEVVLAAQRAAGLTRQLLAFSRRQVLLPEEINLNELLTSLQKMLRRLIGEDVELQVNPSERLYTIRADRGQLEQVLMNLVVNARDAMPSGGRVSLCTANVHLKECQAAGLGVPPGDFVELAIADTGSGMEAEVLDHIFEPFFTTKGHGKGTGLGLSMVYGIVSQSGGGIVVESQPGQGSTFRIYLPRCEQDKTAGASRPTQSPAAGGHETILAVEDEPALRELIRRVLTADGYQVIVAANAGEAFMICEKSGPEIDLVLTDVVMPGMSGTELISRITPLCPSARVIYMSGYTDEALERHGVLGQEFLPKPFEPQSLRERVRASLDRGRL